MFVEQGAARRDGPRRDGAGRDPLREAPTEQIERQIGELGAQIAAATCRWLELIAEFDRREAHEAWGFHSCGAWIAWRCSLDRRSAREHVRVARALAELPLTRAHFGRGELSYSKVRAISRVATSDNEGELVEMARWATAAQLDRVVRGYRRAISPEDAEAAHAERFLSHEWDEDGCLVIRGRLSPEDGALFLRALEAGRAAVRQDSDVSAENADGLAHISESALANNPAVRPAGERYQVVVQVDAAALGGDGEHGECKLADGPAIAVESARRIACDSSVVAMLEGADGSLDVGRKRRAIPPSIRRALKLREPGCRFPGCENRHWVDAHHIRHWADGGETKLDNLVCLCRRHHRLVHEGGFGVERRGDGAVVFRRPDGRVIPAAPPMSNARGRPLSMSPVIGAVRGDLAPLGRGERLDFDLAVEGLAARAGPG